MTLKLELKPETEADLAARARAAGMRLDEYVLSLVERAAKPISHSPSAEREERSEAVRRMMEFGERHHLNLGEPITRQLLHEGHRF